MRSQKIVVAGHICLDITPKFRGTIAQPIDALFLPGKLIEMSGAEISAGGAVANTGLALRKLGSEAALMGKVGDDEFGRLVLRILAGHSAGEQMIVAKGESTSYTVVIAPPGVDRIFLHHRGANDTFCGGDLDYAQIAGAGLFHFGYLPIMQAMCRAGAEELCAVFRRVRALGVLTSLDLAMVDPQTETGRADWRGALEKVVPLTDFFVPSAEELCLLLEPQRYAEWLRRAGKGDVTDVLCVEEDVAPLADELLEMGARIILIKCGAQGIYLRTAGKETLQSLGSEFSQWAGREIFEPSYEPARIVSATGAGDTCIAAFLKAALAGYTPERCLRLAAATGASCVEGCDALQGLRSFGELEAKIAAGWRKLER